MDTKKQGEGKEETKQVMVYLPLSLIEQVKQEAAKNYRSISGEVAYILASYFAQQEKPPAPEQ
jgi:hypothetical protein